ncbi:MAG: hypothetical protein ACR2NP_03565, partial [Pirellulaceae bacterium]
IVLQTVHEVDVQASRGWTEQQHEELTREFFESLRQHDYQLLRQWDQQTDFETWLVIAVRRVVCANSG